MKEKNYYLMSREEKIEFLKGEIRSTDNELQEIKAELRTVRASKE